jgi:hypothetical protein
MQREKGGGSIQPGEERAYGDHANIVYGMGAHRFVKMSSKAHTSGERKGCHDVHREASVTVVAAFPTVEPDNCT